MADIDHPENAILMKYSPKRLFSVTMHLLIIPKIIPRKHWHVTVENKT